MKRAVFRVDASIDIGTGHVMRCLTLAEELRRRGAECEFICRALPGHRSEAIRQRGFPVHVLRRPEDESQGEGAATGRGAYSSWLGVSPDVDAAETLAALGSHPVDWLVVDHYALDASWERKLRPAARNIMVIDDLADRSHDCELLLDQNLGHEPADYDGLVPSHCERLCGPRFALLRPEFARLRPTSLSRRAEGRLRRILITMGGVDKDNATGVVLEALAASELSNNVSVMVIMGSSSPSLDRVRRQAGTMLFQVDIAVDVDDMPERMAASDFAIGAAGSTSWERCCLGLPSALVAIADNQLSACRALASAGAAFDLGRPDNMAAVLPPLYSTIRSEPHVLQSMACAAAAICDGLGVALTSNALFAIG